MANMATTDKDIGACVKSLLGTLGVGRRELAEHLRIDQSALSRALSGERTFKAREIAVIAERLGVSTSRILEGDSDSPSIALAARQSAHDADSINGALSRAEFFVELADVIGSSCVPDFDWLERPEAGLAWEQGQMLADQVLARAELDQEPLPGPMHELAGTLERHLGIQVALEPLGRGMDGLSVCCDRFKLAMVSTSTAPARQRWTLAHEVAHLALNDTQDFLIDESVWTKTPQESRANAFAAAFLMPSHLVKIEWGSAVTPNEDLVAHLLDTFHVSLDALAFRLHNLGLINAAGRDRVRKMYPLVSLIRNQANRQWEGTWLPGKLTTDAIQAYGEGRLGARWLAALLELDPDELLERLRVSAEEADALDAVDDRPLVS